MHSVLSPSSSSVWRMCTAFPALTALNPEIPDPEAELGEIAHDHSAKRIEGGLHNQTPTPIDDEEMEESVELYVDHVLSIARQRGVFGGPNIGIEQRISIPRIHKDCFGTPDAFIFKPPNLHIWDFKYGHLIVEAFENWQTICYYAGLADLFRFDDTVTTVHFHIVQPRAHHKDGPIRTWTINGGLLRNYVNMLHNAAGEAMSANAKLRSGPHCRFCPRRFKCRAAIDAGWQLYEAVYSPVPETPSVEELATHYLFVKRAREQLEYLETGLAEQLDFHMKKGRTVPGCELEPTYGRQSWDAEYNTIISLGKMAGVDLAKQELITPKQAIKKGVPADAVNALSSAKKTGLQLIVDPNKAKRIFQPTK